jgi:hypothetical protein
LADFGGGAEAGGVGVEGVGTIFEDDLKSVDSVSVGVKIVPQIHVVESNKYNITHNSRRINGNPPQTLFHQGWYSE